MRLVDALTQHPAVRIWAVIDSDSDTESDWEVELVDGEVLRKSEINYYFIVKAKNVLPDGTAKDCYIDICLPERISDFAYFLHGERVDARYHHEFDGEIICAVPIDCFGIYDLFYSKTAPEIGIEVLRRGLSASPRNAHIAEDLAYILRDERRFHEAAEMFQLAVDEGPASYFIYGELAACYQEIGESEKARAYQDLFNDPPTDAA
jgi:tetratricopeptide (TPR) repeat protein